MYSKIKNVQIIVSLLKQHNIRHIVLSAGTRHVPIAHSVENDEFFICHSVVDERSAGYYAIGLAKELKEPVAIACTSSTATCNYTPAIAEAYFQKIPLIVLTGDRDPYRLGQLEDQMINQVDMYRNFCKKCVSLPIVENAYDEWYCSRLVNEAILESWHHGGGPVQINFPINQTIDDIADASVETLPEYNKIMRVDYETRESIWKEKLDELKNAKRILIVCGSDLPMTEEQKDAMTLFYNKYPCSFITEYLSNVEFEGAINALTIGESITGQVVKDVVKPDLVIFYGGNYVSRWKTMLRTQKAIFKSWYIDRDGAIVDPFQNLTCVFECSPTYFFNWFAKHNENGKNDKELEQVLLALRQGITIPPMRELYKTVNNYMISDAKFKKNQIPTDDELISEDYLSAFSAMRGVAENIPLNSLLHLSILNSTRITQLFDLPSGTEVYSNIGTDGIDGSMSTFLGQAQIVDKPCYLVIGDLSFFYDMNSVSLRNIGGNVHILLVNNGGGAEFYLSMGPGKLPNIDRHISAAHSHSAKEWVESNGFEYITASNLSEYEEKIEYFIKHEGTPIIFEVFTDKLKDVTVYKGFRRFIHQDTVKHQIAKQIESIPVVQKVFETDAGKK